MRNGLIRRVYDRVGLAPPEGACLGTGKDEAIPNVYLSGLSGHHEVWAETSLRRVDLVPVSHTVAPSQTCRIVRDELSIAWASSSQTSGASSFFFFGGNSDCNNQL